MLMHMSNSWLVFAHSNPAWQPKPRCRRRREAVVRSLDDLCRSITRRVLLTEQLHFCISRKVIGLSTPLNIEIRGPLLRIAMSTIKYF